MISVLSRAIQEQHHDAFSREVLIEQGFFRRLFEKPVPENAYIALENLLAHNNWSNLHEGHISDILRSHGLKRFDHARAIEIYKKAFAKFVEDEAITVFRYL